MDDVKAFFKGKYDYRIMGSTDKFSPAVLGKH